MYGMYRTTVDYVGYYITILRMGGENELGQKKKKHDKQMNAIVTGVGECVNSVSAVSDDDLQTDINPGWRQQFKYEAIDIDFT